MSMQLFQNMGKYSMIIIWVYRHSSKKYLGTRGHSMTMVLTNALIQEYMQQ